MKNLIFSCFILLSFCGFSQLTCPDADGSALTTYSVNTNNDSIYYYCNNTPGTLIATPENGVAGWTFVWQQYDVATNSWVAHSTETNVPGSTISNLAPNGYRVTITDGLGVQVGCYRAWISHVLTDPFVDVDPIPPSCSGPTLNGTIDYGTSTTIYNPPSDPLIIDANTEITVCFTASHTFVSDIGFYLVGPVACGSPVVPLSPNPGSIGQGSICNSGDNVNNLCFSTESLNNLNICTASAPLSGTYGSYGASPTPINWTSIYGCDANQPGWRVQIYDCISADVGSLQATNITFSGISSCGTPTSVSYSATGINSPINDNSCSAASASIYMVPVTPASVMPTTHGYLWTANPYFYIPDSTTSLNFTLNPGPSVPTVFTLQITGNGPGAACGGNTSDSELYTPLFPTPPTVFGNQNVCESDSPYQLNADIPGGTWSGNGIVDPTNGIFDPATAGAGTHLITYSITNPCPSSATIQIEVVSSQTIVIQDPGEFCSDEPAENLISNIPGGTWSGNGITNPINGTFDPAIAGPGVHTITYDMNNSCSTPQTVLITVNQAVDLNVSQDVTICEGESTTLNASGADSFQWSPANYLSDPSIPSPIANPPFSQTYYVTGTNSGGCNQTDSVTITVAPKPVLDLTGSGSYCYGDTVQFSASGALNYTWTPSAGLNASNISNPFTLMTSTMTYTVIGSSQYGCTDTAEITIQLIPVSAVFTIDPLSGYLPLDVTITPGNNTGSYSWNLGDGTSESSSTTFQHTYTLPGTYTISLLVENQGCFASNSINLIVMDECTLKIPNVVTANGDKVNDEFFLESKGVKQMEVTIFNRWGNIVYTMDGLKGAWNCEDVKDGTYFYKIEGVCNNGETLSKNGFITVIK